MAKKEPIEFKQRAGGDVPRGAITLAEIDAVKRAFIERNLSLSPEEAGAIFGKSARWAIGKVKDGVFIAIDGDARMGDNGLQASRGVRITALSVAAYRMSITISPEKWAE